MNSATHDADAAIADLLRTFGRVAVAVSGGVDSLTLATIAGRSHERSEMFHAVSPAVPEEATARVRDLAAREGWRLHLLDAREFERREYVSNPVNRCFYCKQSLYSAIRVIASSTSAQIVSGANLDDLGEYRPGLDAAREHGVRHPFVELGVKKSGIRDLARWLELGEIADLPASPCLSSRIETGLTITSALLQLVHVVERRVRGLGDARSLRCRVRSAAIVVEIDAESLSRLDAEQRLRIVRVVADTFGSERGDRTIDLAPYRVGSAFLVEQVASSRH